MYDAPPATLAVVCTMAGLFSVTITPLVITLLMIGSYGNSTITAWFEIGHHICNVLLLFMGYRGYLAESFLNVQVYTDKLISTIAIAVGAILILALTSFTFHLFLGERWLAFGILPLSETELLLLNSDLIYLKPLWGTLCLVLVAPFTISCMYYGGGFAVACSHHPWLGYLVVSAVIAIPRLSNAFTYSSFAEEFQLYLVQLPVHLIACWSYQKTDTIWTPIFTLMIVNLISCILIWFHFVL